MKRLLPILLFLQAAFTLLAQNPIVGTSFTPDPAPYVHGDKVYLFTGHDEDDAVYFKMKDWQLFCTEDMVNWTYLGTPISTATFPWAFQGDRAWASQAVERNGKWYWYVCVSAAGGGDALAVASADSPAGPYEDAIGGPLATGFSFIDPTVFVDDDGQAYMYWGNPHVYWARLNEDMVSLDGEIHRIEYPIEHYQEGRFPGGLLLHERSRRGARPLLRVHLRRLPLGLVENGALAAAGIIPHPCRWGPCSKRNSRRCGRS